MFKCYIIQAVSVMRILALSNPIVAETCYKEYHSGTSQSENPVENHGDGLASNFIQSLWQEFVFLDMKSIKEKNLVMRKLKAFNISVALFLDKQVRAIAVDDMSQTRASNTESMPLSRSQIMIQLAKKKASNIMSSPVQSCNVVAMGRKLGIPVVHFHDILCMLNNHETSREHAQVPNESVTSLGASFIKVEDSSHNFRPYFAKFKQMPYIDFKPSKGSPFESWYKEENHKRTCKQHSVSFCGLYGVSYTSLKQHLESKQHVAAATDNAYKNVDKLITKCSSLSDFVANIRAKHDAT